MSKRGSKNKGLVKIFSAVGNKVFSVGESFQKVPHSVRRSISLTKKSDASEIIQVPDRVSNLENTNDLLWGDITNSGSLGKGSKFSRKFFKRRKTDFYRPDVENKKTQAVRIIIGSCSITTFVLMISLLLGLPFLFSIIGGTLAFLFSVFFIRTYPKRKLNSRVAEVNRVLPYALRHMSTQLSSGIGLPETITSVSRSDYGVLSEEFARVVLDMNKGVSFEDALARMDDRVPSEPLRKTTRHIRRALRTGGDLAKVLNVLADEAAFEMRMKLRDYTQSLNMITMIYMFVSAVIPAMLMITMNVSSGVGRAGISVEVAGVIYLILLPFLLVYFVIMIKKLEPRL